jgi:hypothetical protein
MNVLAFGGERLDGLGVGIDVSPLLDVDEAGAVVDLEGCVCGLGGDGVDLADEGELASSGHDDEARTQGTYLGYFAAVDFELGVGVG